MTNKDRILNKLRKTNGDLAKYVLLTCAEVEYSREGENAHFKGNFFDTHEQVSKALERKLMAFENNPHLYNNDWAMHYQIIMHDPENNRYKRLNEGRIWRVPRNWFW